MTDYEQRVARVLGHKSDATEVRQLLTEARIRYELSPKERLAEIRTAEEADLEKFLSEVAKHQQDPPKGAVRRLLEEYQRKASHLFMVTKERDVERARGDRLEAQRDELRAVLAPLLDKPFEYIDTEACLFCNGDRHGEGYGPVHDEGCPVLRKDELLGRS